MNAHEECIRDFAHQIWESEGCPVGHEYRHWEMACKLAETKKGAHLEEKVTSQIKSVIAPEEPLPPNPKPEIDPAPTRPEQPTRPNVPVDPISPTQPPPHISPTPPPQPIQPYGSKHTTAAIKSALKADGVKPVSD